MARQTAAQLSDRAMLAAALERTGLAQQKASDPNSSAWVSANAGTGKTHVLTARILRLLLSGTKPERILALTYTKAAAAEMSKRVFHRLGAWVTAPQAELENALATVLGRAANSHELVRARQLFASAIETPGGLKVQTIHGFCERLLQRFPLEAGVPPHFEILDEPTTAALLRSSLDKTLTEASADPSSALARALGVAVSFASDDAFEEVLRDALGKRSWLEGLSRLDSTGGGDPVDEAYRRVFQLPLDLDVAGAERTMAAVLDGPLLKRVAEVLRAGKATDQKLGTLFAEAAEARSDRERVRALRKAFLTADNEPRADRGFITKDIRAAEPVLTEALCVARDRFPALLAQRQKLVAVQATVALATLADAVMDEYRAAKARRAALDFDDLITKTARLLGEASADSGASAARWVLFKLDGGLDHVLVDEAQDTSPQQWAVIEALAAEFFGTGAGSGGVRTVFAVGDEKQSIYGFQGAAPEMFKRMGETFSSAARVAGHDLAHIPLDASFRTTAPVLFAVDRVFADQDRVGGVSAASGVIRHIAMRTGHAGLVEIWPTEIPDKREETATWDPNAEKAASPPITRLASRIATHIQGWLDNGEILASEGRPVRPEDILILVRRRRPFAAAMVAALKARGIPVAGADRLTLSDQIAVQDLMALGDFLTLPEDDLSLACVLKSPLFGLIDDDLMPLAWERKGQLWTALLDTAKSGGPFAKAAELLKRWRSEADFLPPYEFFAKVLDRDNGAMRKRMLARLGPEAADPIDEFLNQALHYDDKEPASLTGFLAHVRASQTEVKRDMEQGRNEVRVMTVHGAKGLEAPIVFLPDTCSSRSGGMPGGLLKLTNAGLPNIVDHLMLWPVKNTSSIKPVQDAREAVKRAELHERNRLLYVAMTRPRDRLYVTGYEGQRPPEPDSWYCQIRDALEPLAEKLPMGDGRDVLRLSSPQAIAPKPASYGTAEVLAKVSPPAWLAQKPKSEPRLSMPLAPSRLAPLDSDDAGEPVAAKRLALAEPTRLPPSVAGDKRRFLRGTLTHALLEHLPAFAHADREVAARRYLAVRASELGEAAQRSMLSEVMAILADQTFAPLFGPDSQAEIPIVAEIARPSGKGPPLRLNGQIDRLARIGNTVLIVDYKTNRPPPKTAAEVAETYVLQLAAYRLALQLIFPGTEVAAAILWTDGARLMPIPASLLDGAENRLWMIEPSTP